MMRYLLDTNALITAKNRFYAFDILPSFWSWLEQVVHRGECAFLDVVADEIKAGDDGLVRWIREKIPKASILKTKQDEYVFAQYREIAEVVYHDPIFSAENKEQFMSVADPWLIAAGKTWGDTIVTFETIPGNGSKKVKIPVIAQRMGVRVVDLYQMMRELHAAL